MSNISIGMKFPKMKSGSFSVLVKGISPLAFIRYINFLHQSLRKIKMEIVCFSSITDWVTMVNCPVRINGQSYHFILVWRDNQVHSINESISYPLSLSTLCLATDSWRSELLRTLNFAPWVCSWSCASYRWT